MKHIVAAVYFALLTSSTASIAQEETGNSRVIVSHGVLARNGKAGTLWILRTNDPLKFQNETILQVTFTTAVREASIAYAAYEGKPVELVGEVKEVSHGNAVLSRVLTIGILPFLDLSAYSEAGSGPPNSAVFAPYTSGRIAYKHAYYLFLSDAPKGCERCYVPLLISQPSLEEIAQGREAQHCVFIYTYERNSIWEIRGAAPVDPSVIETQPRIIHVNGRSYRYQEVPPTEVLKLLEKPYGTIPISRPLIINKTVPGASLSELIADFHALVPGAKD
jgi:hypothetical protein